jgi:Mn2+/Fe2+ NRAMP family transporter
LIVATGVVGTTLAPWGLAFIQSYAADKKLKRSDLTYERIDVISGAVLTGIIGVFVVIACAATLFATGNHQINDASQAALALKPLAGRAAATLFGVGLVGAALLAAAIVPLATAYSVSEAFGRECKLDDSFSEAPFFYITFFALLVVGAGVVVIPGVPLVPVLFITQVVNAVLLLPLLIALRSLGRDESVLGNLRNRSFGDALAIGAFAVVAASILALAVAAFL